MNKIKRAYCWRCENFTEVYEPREVKHNFFSCFCCICNTKLHVKIGGKNYAKEKK